VHYLKIQYNQGVTQNDNPLHRSFSHLESYSKGSKDLASLLVGTQKNFFAWGMQIFCE